MLSVDDLRFFLKNNIAGIKLENKSKKLKCTLKEEYIPYSESKETKIQRNSKDPKFFVWDIENSSWESFRIENIKYIELT